MKERMQDIKSLYVNVAQEKAEAEAKKLEQH